MIDPKLNELPVTGKTAVDRSTAEVDPAERQRRSRAGLSINDTIAGDTLLSSGSRGVDTSGVAAGAGAGGGSSIVTAGVAGESPAPDLVGGARGSGTTVRGSANQTDLSESASTAIPLQTGAGTANTLSGTPNTLEVAQRAYEIWCAKGCPEGTADEDWLEAERQLESGGTTTSFARAASR